VGQLDVKGLRIAAPGGTEVGFHDVSAASGRLSRSRILARELHIDGGAFVVDGTATLIAGDPLGLEADVRYQLRAGGRTVAGSATSSGTLAALAVRTALNQPAGARFAGTAGVLDGLAVDGRVTLERFDPSSLGLALGLVTGELDVAGELARFRIDGAVAATRLPLGTLTIAARGGYAESSLRIDRFAVATPRRAGSAPASIVIMGQIDLGARPRVDLSGHWQDLCWPFDPRHAVLTSHEGSLHVDGGGPFHYGLEAALSGAAFPSTTLTASGEIDGSRLSVGTFEAHLADGSVSGVGQVDFAGRRLWSAAIRGQGIDPGAFRDQLPGRINFAAQGAGEGFEPFGHWDARLEHLDGTVRGLPARGHAALQVRGSRLTMEDVRVAFGSAQLDAGGSIGDDGQFHWQLAVGRLGDFVTGGHGSLQSHGTISGDLAHLSARATLAARALGVGDWRVADLEADADLDATDRRPSTFRLTARELGDTEFLADALHVTLDGRTTDHALKVDVEKQGETAELEANGAFRDGHWTLRLETLRVSGPPLYAYRLEEPSTIVLARQAASATRTCLVRDASRLCAEGTWSASQPWAAALDAAALPLKLAGLGAPKGTDYDGSLSGRLAARGSPGQAWTGEGALELAGALFRYRGSNGKTEQIDLDRAHATFEVTHAAMGGSVDVATRAGSSLSATVQLARQQASLVRAPLTGRLTLATSELGALPTFIPGVDRVAGQFTADLRVSGTASAPLLAGAARLAQGELDVHRTNLLLRQIEAELTTDGAQLTLAAKAATRGGTASATGHYTWHDGAPNGTLEFKGQKLVVADLPEAKVLASPDLRFGIEGRRITVQGDVVIPSAKLAPHDLRGAVLPSGDEHIVTEEEPSKGSAFSVDASVRLVLGDDVAIDAYGLRGKLGGSLLVTARGGEVPYGSGEFNVREGTYTAYSRKLDIDRGRLLFAGQSLGNPGLDIRAQRKIDQTIAGVNVRGTLLKPQISFYSDPAMSQSQIAAMLIIGKSLDSIQDPSKTSVSGSDTRNTAIAQGSALLAGQLGRYVGISEVGVETGTNNETSFVIGKYLSPKLYVSYGVSLTQAINTLKLRYTISDRWVIRTESGEQQSVDIEYTIGR
jgi:translocation and assembly module TamB